MNTESTLRKLALAILLIATLNPIFATAHAQGTAFTYQGQLQNNGGPASGSYAMQFALYATNATGVPVAGPVTNNPVAVTSGLFTTFINFGGVFSGTNYWLDIAVSTNGTNFTELTPRQQLTPVPYAIFAETSSNLSGSVLAAQVSGTLSSTQLPASVVTNNASGLTLNGTFNGNGAGVTNVNATSFNGVNASNFWQLAGNNVSTGNFLGSANFQPVELWANGNRAFRLEPTTNNLSHSNIVNVVGGSLVNYVKPGTYGAVIAGGGAVLYPGGGSSNVSNSIAADMSSIGGGFENTILTSALVSVIAGGQQNSIGTGANNSVIGGGYLNSISADDGDSTIAGGSQNTMTAPLSFIGGGGVNSVAGGQSVVAGGYDNTASAGDAFIGGGYQNTIGLNANYSVLVGGYNNTLNASDSVLVGGFRNVIQSGGNYDTLVGGYQNYIQSNTIYAFLGGGDQNTNSGAYSVVPGGLMNYAGGQYSFAAGQQAKANFQGDFVWADSQAADFNSTANDQFLIRAQGGVGINKTNPAAALDVAGTINGALFTGNGGGLTDLPAANLTGVFPQSALPATVVTNDESAVTLGSLYVGGLLLLDPTIINANVDVITPPFHQNFPLLISSFYSSDLFLGLSAGSYFSQGASGLDDTGIGYSALASNTNGNENTALGCEALYSVTSGSGNLGLGFLAGYNVTSGSNNIEIGHQGAASDNGIIRIGIPGVQTQTYIAGVINGNGAGLTNLSAAQLTGFSYVTPPAGGGPILNMVWIVPGTFIMGAPTSDPDYVSDETQHVVTLTNGFWMGQHPVTQGEYLAVIGSNPSYFAGDLSRPVEQVNWLNATNYCYLLTQQEQSAGRLPAGWVYRLPTESEWEYCCRALNNSRFYFGNDAGDGNSLTNYAWYSANNFSATTTQPVGQLLPNAWGLVDMAGNVQEWCQDWYGTYPTANVSYNPQGPASGGDRILRGGCWGFLANACRSASRNAFVQTYEDDTTGFRVVLAPDH